MLDFPALVNLDMHQKIADKAGINLDNTADIIADTRVRVYSLQPERLCRQEDPVATRVKQKLLSNLPETSMARMGRMNLEIRTLTRQAVRLPAIYTHS
jgi:hypothetical protein